MSEETLSSAELRDALKKAGIEAIFPQSSSFLSPTPRNKRMTVYPEALTLPTNAEQVARIVKVGRKFKRRVVALSGGHSSIANGIGGSNGALVIDLGKLKAITFNPSNNRITIQTGNRLKDVVAALRKYKRGFAHGVCDDVGIGGHPAFGGFGLASRMWGLNCDAIHSMQVVLEDGTLRDISADNANDQDLFWAMRGAGPSYAIATSITYMTFDPPRSTTDYKFSRNMSYQDAARVVFDFQASANNTTRVPRELGFQFRVDRGRRPGMVNLTLSGSYFGPRNTFFTVIQPFLKNLISVPIPFELTVDSNHVQFPAADPATFFEEGYAATWTGDYFNSVERSAADVTLTGDSIQYAKILDEVNWTGPETDLSYIRKVVTPGLRGNATKTDIPHPDPLISFYIKSLMTPALSRDALTGLMRYAAVDGFDQDLNWFVSFKLFGGENSAISEGDSSFGWRNALWFMEFDGDSGRIPYPDYGYRFLDNLVKRITDKMQSTTFGAYPGFLDDRLENFLQLYYGTNNYARLRQIKRASARSEVFSFPQSIPPA